MSIGSSERFDQVRLGLAIDTTLLGRPSSMRPEASSDRRGEPARFQFASSAGVANETFTSWLRTRRPSVPLSERQVSVVSERLAAYGSGVVFSS